MTLVRILIVTKRITIAVLFVFLFGIVQIPVWSVRIPPLVDYPNHLARMHILAHHHETPLLQKYYLIKWAVLPKKVCAYSRTFLRFITL